MQAKEAWDLSDEEKVALAQKRKAHGNALFKAAKWARAIAKYKSAAEAVGYDVRHCPILQPILCTILQQEASKMSKDCGQYNIFRWKEDAVAYPLGGGMLPCYHQARIVMLM